MSKLIPLSRGLFATVDDADFEWLNQWKWSALKVARKGATPRFYAVRMTKKGEIEGRPKMVLMHRVIADSQDGQVTDHRDNDGLNNRRFNIRACTQAQNCLNHGGHRDRAASKYKGVEAHAQSGKWCARFRGKYLGIFPREEQAAQAYDLAAMNAEPDFAKPNFSQKEAA